MVSQFGDALGRQFFEILKRHRSNAKRTFMPRKHVMVGIAHAKIFFEPVDQLIPVEFHEGIEAVVNFSHMVDQTRLFSTGQARQKRSKAFPQRRTSREDRPIEKFEIAVNSHTGIASKVFSTLADLKVNIQMISTSEIRVSVVINEDLADDATRALHAAFGLDQGPDPA